VDFDRAGFDREVGLRLQRARKDQGITQAELASRIGLQRASYANIESGRQRVPLDVVWRAAIVLGRPMAELAPEPLPGRSDSGPLSPFAASVISPSPRLANMTTFGPSAQPAESMGFMAWRESPDSTED
jgi:transcriptional regulator with XRE-family HTH domain